MKKIWLILRYELRTTLNRPSFLIIGFGVPLLAILIVAAVSVFRGDSSDAGDEPSGAAESFELEVEGYVDQAGVIGVIPEDIPSGLLVSYRDETQAQAALEADEIAAYYVIPEDYVETGNLIYVHPDPNPLSQTGQDWVMRWTLLVNLVGGNAKLAGRIWNPMDIQATNLDPAQQYDAYAEEDCTQPGYACESNFLVRYIPAIILVLFYVFIMTGSGLLIRSVSKEKENRMIEILMMASTPRQMLTGKIIGLGIACLLETAAWVGTVFVLASLGGQTLNLPEGFILPPAIMGWGLAFFLLGYAVYASLMAGAGALVPKMKEANQAMWPIMMPMLLSYVVGFIAATEGPHDILPTILSLFPLTAPPVMMMRLATGGVPLWQPILSAVLMALTAVFTVRASARMFHAQELLSGQPFSVRRYFAALLGRA